jgi:hypothetical protein
MFFSVKVCSDCATVYSSVGVRPFHGSFGPGQNLMPRTLSALWDNRLRFKAACRLVRIPLHAGAGSRRLSNYEWTPRNALPLYAPTKHPLRQVSEQYKRRRDYESVSASVHAVRVGALCSYPHTSCTRGRNRSLIAGRNSESALAREIIEPHVAAHTACLSAPEALAQCLRSALCVVQSRGTRGLISLVVFRRSALNVETLGECRPWNSSWVCAPGSRKANTASGCRGTDAALIADSVGRP